MQYNQLTALPHSMTRLTKLSSLFLVGNPWEPRLAASMHSGGRAQDLLASLSLQADDSAQLSNASAEKGESEGPLVMRGNHASQPQPTERAQSVSSSSSCSSSSPSAGSPVQGCPLPTRKTGAPHASPHISQRLPRRPPTRLDIFPRAPTRLCLFISGISPHSAHFPDVWKRGETRADAGNARGGLLSSNCSSVLRMLFVHLCMSSKEEGVGKSCWRVR